MKNAIILHGRPGKEEYYSDSYPSASNYHWLPWLQKQLLMRDIPAQTPEVPNAYRRHYPTWCKEFERYDITPETILVGHSLGGGFIVRWLSEHKDVKVGKVVLVAPWLDPDNIDDDDEDIHRSVKIIANTVKGVTMREFQGYGHFTMGSMKTEKLPELLAEIIQDAQV